MLIENKCPHYVAKYIADFTLVRKDRYASEAHVSYSGHEWCGSVSEYPSTLFIFPGEQKSAEETESIIRTPLHKATYDMYDKHKEHFAKKVSTALGSLRTGGFTHACKTNANGYLNTDGFEKIIWMNPTMGVQMTAAFQVNLESVPLPGAAVVITVVWGYCQICAVSFAWLAENGFTFESFVAMLGDEEYDRAISKLPWFGVGSGHSLFLPFGWIPIIVGLPSSDEAENECSAFIMNYILDAQESQKQYSTAARIDMEAVILKATKRKTSIFEGATGKIVEWTKTWAVPVETTVTADVAQASAPPS